ncbi:MAG TPA: hypothetical protein VKU00_02705 [Chthonomonadaceae bacterium]|nr:hypothetical protein [Chthonomonadaceae bacterium]
MKRKYSALTLRDAMQLIPAVEFTPWELNVPPYPPSELLPAIFHRLEVFDLETSELAKTLLMDALFGEIVPNHLKLKVWKAAALETDTLTGIADYLITPRRAYIATPLLCVAEAKRDDFVQGRAQCVAEMVACLWHNLQEGYERDVFGIVSNGQGWQFYKLTPQKEIFETRLYVIGELSELLGVLDYVCSECAKSLP